MNCKSETLLKRYLEAVAVWLPAAQRNDIAAELNEDLRSRIDDREAELGHGVNEDELVEVLKGLGHPLAVAGRYSSQQYLIGPALFPLYRFLLKLVVLWIQLPLFALILGPIDVLASAHPVSTILQTAGHYLTAAVVAFMVITVIFALLERHPAKTAHQWNPRRLSRFTIPKAILDADPKAWARGVSQAVFSLVFALGWQYVVQHWNSFGFGPFGRKLDPILQATFWPLMISLLAGVAQGITTLLFPARTQLRVIFRLANAALSLVVLFILFQMRAIEQVAAVFMSSSGFIGSDAPWIRIGPQLPLLIVAAAIVGDAALELLRLKRAGTTGRWTLKPAPGK